MLKWLLAQARAGNLRVLKVLGAIDTSGSFSRPLFGTPSSSLVDGSGWTSGWRRRSSPPSSTRSPSGLGPGGCWLRFRSRSGDAVAGRRLSVGRQLVGAFVFFVGVLILPAILAGDPSGTVTRLGAISGLTFLIGFYGLLVACLIFALVLTLAWGLGSWIAAALVGGALGVLVALSAYIGLLPGSRVIDLPAEWLQVGGWNGVVLDLAISALVGGALFLLAKAWRAPVVLRRPLVKLVPVAAVFAWLLPMVFGYSALMTVPRGCRPRSTAGAPSQRDCCRSSAPTA